MLLALPVPFQDKRHRQVGGGKARVGEPETTVRGTTSFPMAFVESKTARQTRKLFKISKVRTSSFANGCRIETSRSRDEFDGEYK